MHNNNIPVRNIYYMMAYAFKNLDRICGQPVSAEPFGSVHDLLAVILSKAVSNQIKRGLYKEYTEVIEELSCLKGRVNFTSTVKEGTQARHHLICGYHEFGINTYVNQVIKTAMLLLLKKGDIKPNSGRALKKCLMFFQEADSLNSKSIKWSSIAYHRNNIAYETIMNICRLIIEGLLMTEEDGAIKLHKYLDGQELHRLYEKFVLRYFQKEHPELKASAGFINWNVKTKNESNFIPRMKSDIMLTHGNKTLIIDTKFYSSILRKQYNKYSLDSGHLYQIFAYVKNKDAENSGNVSGMLLYAQTQNEIIPHETYNFGGNEISIRCLNLSREWEHIKNTLDAAASEFANRDYK